MIILLRKERNDIMLTNNASNRNGHQQQQAEPTKGADEVRRSFACKIRKIYQILMMHATNFMGARVPLWN
jgi:hypothetical protein